MSRGRNDRRRQEAARRDQQQESVYNQASQTPDSEQQAYQEWFQQLSALQRFRVRMGIVSAWLMPLWFMLFALGCWALYIAPGTVTPWALPVPYLHAKPEAVSVLQLVPSTRHASWQLGHLAGQAQVLKSQHPSNTSHEVTQQLQDLCAQAARLLSVNSTRVTVDMLQQIGELILSQEEKGGVLNKVKGLFKFANMMWLVGILGVSVSLGPALVVLFGPIIKILLMYATKVATFVWALLTPFLYGGVSYLLWSLVAAAQSQPPQVAPFLAFLGVALETAALIRISHALQRSITNPYRNLHNPVLTDNLFAMLSLAPLAVLHTSKLLGFFTAAALFSALGFAVIPIYCGWLVGWESKSQMVRTAITAAVIIGVNIAAHVAGVAPEVLEPFQLGLNVLGTNCLLLAGLIMSGSYYRGKFWLNNTLYFLLLMALTLSGALLGLDSMFAVGATYTALWLSQTGICWAFEHGLGIVGVLVGSLLTCAGGYFIHTHPDWLVKVLS